MEIELRGGNFLKGRRSFQKIIQLLNGIQINLGMKLFTLSINLVKKVLLWGVVCRHFVDGKTRSWYGHLAVGRGFVLGAEPWSGFNKSFEMFVPLNFLLLVLFLIKKKSFSRPEHHFLPPFRRQSLERQHGGSSSEKERETRFQM